VTSLKVWGTVLLVVGLIYDLSLSLVLMIAIQEKASMDFNNGGFVVAGMVPGVLMTVAGIVMLVRARKRA